MIYTGYKMKVGRYISSHQNVFVYRCFQQTALKFEQSGILAVSSFQRLIMVLIILMRNEHILLLANYSVSINYNLQHNNN